MNFYSIYTFSWRFLTLYIVLAMAMAVIMLLRRERNRRQLQLGQSREELEIKRLVASGRISREEGEKLLASCNPLPEVSEIAPVPDMHLRLVAIFGEVFSASKFVIGLGSMVLYLILFMRSDRPEFHWSIGFHGEGLWILLPLWLVILVLAVFEYRAAKQLPYGDVKGRNFLVFNWIVSFLLMQLVLIWYDSAAFLLVLFGCGLYSLYVLLFRPDADRYFTGSPIGQGGRGKIACVILTALAIGGGLCSVSVTYKYVADYYRVVDSEMHFRLYFGVAGRPEEVLVIQGTPDAETAELCRKISEELAKTYKIPCPVRRFGDPVEVSNRIKQMAVLVAAEANMVFNAENEPSIGRKIQAYLSGYIFYWMRSNSIFQIRLLGMNSGSTVNYKGLKFRELDDGYGYFWLSASMSGSEERNRERISKRFAWHFRVFFRNSEDGYPFVELPEIKLPEANWSELKLDSVRNLELIYKGHSLEYTAFMVYRFEMDIQEQSRQALLNELEAKGFRPIFPPGGHQELLHGDTGTIELRYTWDWDFLHYKARDKYGYIVYTARNPASWHATPDTGFLQELMTRNPDAFFLMRGLEGFKGKMLADAFVGMVWALKERMAVGEKYMVLLSTAEPEARKAIGRDWFYFFRIYVDELLQEPLTRFTFERIRDTFHLAELDPEYREYWFGKLGDNYHKVVFPAEPDAEGRYISRFQVKRDPLAGQWLMLEVKLPSGMKLIRIIGFNRNGKAQYSFFDTPDYFMTAEYLKKHVFREQRLYPAGFNFSDAVEIAPFGYNTYERAVLAKEPVLTDGLAIDLSIDVENKSYDIEVMYNPRRDK